MVAQSTEDSLIRSETGPDTWLMRSNKDPKIFKSYKTLITTCKGIIITSLITAHERSGFVGSFGGSLVLAHTTSAWSAWAAWTL